MSGLLEKIKGFAERFKGNGGSFGVDPIDIYGDSGGYEVFEDDYEEEPIKTVQPRRNEKSKYQSKRSRGNEDNVVRLNERQTQVIISDPRSINDASTICDDVHSGKTVIVKLEKVNHDTAQRIVDFISGVAYSLDGSIECVSNKIFVIAPNSVDLSGSTVEDVRETGFESFPFRSGAV